MSTPITLIPEKLTNNFYEDVRNLDTNTAHCIEFKYGSDTIESIVTFKPTYEDVFGGEDGEILSELTDLDIELEIERVVNVTTDEEKEISKEYKSNLEEELKYNFLKELKENNLN